MKVIKVLIVFLFFVHCSFSQSAWVQSKGNVYTQLSYNDISNYKRIFNKDGDDLYTSRVISDRTINWYTEFGLSKKVTLLTSVPFKLLEAGEEVKNSSYPITIKKGGVNTFGNVNVGLRYKLNHKKYAIATQIQVEAPTSKFDHSTGLSSGINAFTFSPTISLGNGTKRLFFQIHTGLLLRTNNYSNGFKFYLEGGRKFFNQLWVIAFIDVFDSFEDGTVNVPIQNLETALNLDKSEYGGFGIKLIEQLTEDFGITTAFGGAFSAHLEAYNVSLNLGVYYKFKAISVKKKM